MKPSVPQVKINPILLTLQSFLTPFETLEQLAQQYGEIFQTQVAGLPPTIILSHPEDIKTAIMGGYSLFDSGETNNLLEPFLGANSLLLLDGEAHQQRKKILSPPFARDAIQRYGQTIEKSTAEMLGRWKQNQPISACPSMRELALHIILQLIWDLEREDFWQIEALISQWLALFSSPLTASIFFFPQLRQDWGRWSPWGKFLRLRKQIDEFIYQKIEEKRTQNLEEFSLLSWLLAAHYEDGSSLSDLEIRNELVTLLFAGHETTAAALSWGLYWIHRQPEVKTKLLDELASLREDLDLTQLAKLPYLTAVCQETLRIYPINLMAEGRILKDSLTLRNYEFQPGDTFMPCIYLLHQRQDLYPQPRQFKPERFLERKYSPFEYLPFGGGNRLCLGMNLALFEMKIILASILLKWRLEYRQKKNLKPVRRGTVMTPPDSFQLIPRETLEPLKKP
jgi:cytochrome P450